MAQTRLVITHGLTAAQFLSIVPLNERRRGTVDLASFIEGCVGGLRSAKFEAQVGAVQATAAFTFTGLPVANETCSIANTTFTAKSSGATGNQFNIGADATATAANFAAAINASSSLAGIVTASAAAGVVTLTAVAPGKIGNGLQASESLTNCTATAFASGADGSAFTHDFT